MKQEGAVAGDDEGMGAVVDHHGRRGGIAGRLVGRPPDRLACIKSEAHHAGSLAAANIHDHMITDHQRARARAKVALRRVEFPPGMSLPDLSARGNIEAGEHAVGAKGDHAVAGDGWHAERSVAAPHLGPEPGGVVCPPECLHGLGVESIGDLAVSLPVKEKQPPCNHGHARVSAADRPLPDLAGPGVWPAIKKLFIGCSDAGAVRPEDLWPVASAALDRAHTEHDPDARHRP